MLAFLGQDSNDLGSNRNEKWWKQHMVTEVTEN